MANGYFSNYGDETQETWDFRSFFVHYESVAFVKYQEARELDDYPRMLKIIDEIHSEIFGRIKKRWEDEDETFNNIRDDIIKSANNHSKVWTKRSFDSQGITDIRDKFNKAISYIMFLIDKNELFGKRKNVAGL